MTPSRPFKEAGGWGRAWADTPVGPNRGIGKRLPQPPECML